MFDYSKYANGGLTGLANLGNTCYLNSCMQIISHCYPLNELLSQLNNDNNINKKINDCIDSVLLLEWNNLRQLMWSKNCVISPNRYINSVQKISSHKNRELFSGFIQNDFPEFLVFLLECFHNALRKEVTMKIEGNINNKKDIVAKKCYEVMKKQFSKDYSEIINMFYGIQTTRLTSFNNKLLNIIPEPYCLISLPVTKECNNIYDCLDLYCENEVMKDENAWFNDKTNSYENVNKDIKFWNLPDILIIDLKRFNNNLQKINKLIEVPLENINFEKYVIGYNSNSYIYDLFGVCNHMGSTFGGHYTANVKNANNNWYEFNDTTVSLINSNKVITNNAYCFFFIKKNN